MANNGTKTVGDRVRVGSLSREVRRGLLYSGDQSSQAASSSSLARSGPTSALSRTLLRPKMDLVATSRIHNKVAASSNDATNENFNTFKAKVTF